MKLKSKFAYIAIGGLLTLACYFLITLGVGIFTPQNASAQDDSVDAEIASIGAPTEEEVQADLIGQRINFSRGGTKWFQVTRLCLHFVSGY